MGGIVGIEKVGDHWVWFTESGHEAGRFTQEAARWGSWITPDNALRINAEDRLIDMEDVRAAMKGRVQ